MFGRKAAHAAAVLVVAAATAGATACFRSTAPPGWLPPPEDVQRQAFGGWVRVQDRAGTPTVVYEGELIAVDADTVHVLYDRLVSLPRASFCCITVTTFATDYSPVTLWGIAGTLSAASHGWGLILSAPVWGLVATGAAVSASRAPRVVSTDPAVLRPFARFPQGIPPGLDRATLRAKSVGNTGQPSTTGQRSTTGLTAPRRAP
jgi:hypothetical protein